MLFTDAGLGSRGRRGGRWAVGGTAGAVVGLVVWCGVSEDLYGWFGLRASKLEKKDKSKVQFLVQKVQIPPQNKGNKKTKQDQQRCPTEFWHFVLFEHGSNRNVGTL